jgi:hypothetical protein
MQRFVLIKKVLFFERIRNYNINFGGRVAILGVLET